MIKLYLLLGTFLSLISYGQWDPYPTDTENQIHDFVEEMPEFPEGEEAMFEFLYDKFQFSPNMLLSNESRIELYVSFVVLKTGLINNIEVRLNRNSPEAFKELKRVIQQMPKWNPGKQAGKAVNVRFTIPFKLNIYTPYNKFNENNKLILKDGKPDTTVIYKNPSIPAAENAYLPLYWQLINENIHRLNSLLNDTINHFYSILGVINTNGRFHPEKIISKKHSPLLDSLALEAAKQLPDFFPARINGELVNSYYKFGFTLQSHPSKIDYNSNKRNYSGSFLLGAPLFRRYFESEFNYAILPSSITEPFNVYIGFNVDENGRLTNLSGYDIQSPIIEKEIIRVLKTMSGWRYTETIEFQKKRIINILIDPADREPKFTPTPFDRNQNH